MEARDVFAQFRHKHAEQKGQRRTAAAAAGSAPAAEAPRRGSGGGGTQRSAPTPPIAPSATHALQPSRPGPPPPPAAGRAPRSQPHQQRNRREAPAQLADALGSHAAAAGSRRNQALALAASLKMGPRLTSSAREGSTPRQAAQGPAPSVAAAPPVMPPPARQQGGAQAVRLPPAGQEQQLSVRSGSGQGACPAPEPAASIRSSAGDAPASAVGHQRAAPPAAAAATQQTEQLQPQKEQSLEPYLDASAAAGCFADARNYLQRLAAGASGGG